MTLIKSLKRHFLFAIAAFFLLDGSVYAKKYKLEGQVLDPNQEGIMVFALKSVTAVDGITVYLTFSF